MLPGRNSLLTLMQESVPLLRDPWSALGRSLGADGEAVRAAVEEIRRAGLLRRIGGIFDLGRLGYRRSLAALAVGEDRLDRAGRVVADHPGVSHAYARQDERYRLWFTLAVSPESTLGLEGTARRLGERAGATSTLILPAKRQYKLHVRFSSNGRIEPPGAPLPARTQPSIILCETQRSAVRTLQADLPATPEPFAELADGTGLSADDLLVMGADCLASGVMRRYAAVPDHRAVGAVANVLAAWSVPDELADTAGRHLARHPAVSHAYLRLPADDWPFNLYAMVHGPTREQCLSDLDDLSQRIGQPPRRDLWTLREFRKHPVELFSPREARWERQTA